MRSCPVEDLLIFESQLWLFFSFFVLQREKSSKHRHWGWTCWTKKRSSAWGHSWLHLQGQCNYNMLSPWCTALQEHVACNYGFFTSIKTHRIHSLRASSCLYYLAGMWSDQSSSLSLYKAWPWHTVLPGWKKRLRKMWEEDARTERRMKTMRRRGRNEEEEEVLYFYLSWPVLSNRGHQVLQAILRSSALFRWRWGLPFLKPPLHLLW